MHPYFMNFHVKGEVAGTLLMKSTKPKLLVDISRQTAANAQAPGFRYPDRVCFTIRDERLILRFQREVSIGDVIEAHGAFEQSGYLPHGNIHVDTMFEMRSFCNARENNQICPTRDAFTKLRLKRILTDAKAAKSWHKPSILQPHLPFMIK